MMWPFSKKLDMEFEIEKWKLKHQLFLYKMTVDDMFKLKDGKLSPTRELYYLRQAVEDFPNLVADMAVSFDNTILTVIESLLYTRYDELKKAIK